MSLHLTTLLARSPARLEGRIKQLVDKYAREGRVCMFALTAREDLDAEWMGWWKMLSRVVGERTVGCLTSPFARTRLRGLKGREELDLSGLVGCSVGVFEAGEATVFRSSIEGDRQVQVGRWHSFRKGADRLEEMPWGVGECVSWDDVWSQKSNGTVKGLDLGATKTEDVHSLVYFTDRHYQGLARTLVESYHSASKMGLIATPTLTLTELPATMLHGSNIHSTGAVGLALTGQKWSQDLEFGPSLRSISDVLQVGDSQGNIIHTLSSLSGTSFTNPTHLLLTLLENTPGTSASNPALNRFINDKVFIGQVKTDASGGNRVERIARLTAGDPSRGGLAVGAGGELEAGANVQFFIQTTDTPTTLSLPQSSAPTPSFRFTSVPELPYTHASELSQIERGEEDIVELEGTFLAASDVGVVVHSEGAQGECVGMDCPVGTVGVLSARGL